MSAQVDVLLKRLAEVEAERDAARDWLNIRLDEAEADAERLAEALRMECFSDCGGGVDEDAENCQTCQALAAHEARGAPPEPHPDCPCDAGHRSDCPRRPTPAPGPSVCTCPNYSTFMPLETHDKACPAYRIAMRPTPAPEPAPGHCSHGVFTEVNGCEECDDANERAARCTRGSCQYDLGEWTHAPDCPAR